MLLPYCRGWGMTESDFVRAYIMFVKGENFVFQQINPTGVVQKLFIISTFLP